MKRLLLIVAACGMLAAADIDVKLYENDQPERYYDEIQQQIDAVQKNKSRDPEILQEEKLQLSRVRAAAEQTPQIERYDVKALQEVPLGMSDCYDGVNAVATLRLNQKRQLQLLRDIQSKLQFLKQSIERITEAEKPRLLIYQLQFAYYKLQQKNLEAKGALLETHETEVISALTNSITALQCDTPEEMNKRLAEDDATLEELQKERLSQEIEWERALIEESGRRDEIVAKREAIETRRNKALETKGRHLAELALCLLHQERNSDFFKQLARVEALSEQMNAEGRLRNAALSEVLRDLSQKLFGTTTLVFGATWQETKEMASELKAYLTAPIFVFNEQPISLLSLFKAVVIIIIGFLLGGFYKRWVMRMSRHWPDMSQMSIRLASNIGYYLIVFIVLMIAISSIGIDLTSLSLIAGALSIGIGFGLQTVVSNLIAGIILMFERTIRIGDTIEISDVLRGRVTDMRIRSTTVKTFDNVDIVVPNSSFIQNNVINWTLEDRTRRLHIPFGVAYGTEVEKVKRAVLDDLHDSELHYIKDDPEKSPEVWMVSMSSSSVDFELLVWVEWASPLKPNSLRSDFMILIYNALYRNGITIPFPQLDLYLKEVPVSLQGKKDAEERE